MDDEQAPYLSWPFRNLSLEALAAIDKAAGPILDETGFGDISIHIEFHSVKRIIHSTSRKVDIALLEAA